MPLQELKQIIANQKTVSTSRLEPLVRQIEKIIIQQGQKINGQKKSIRNLNKRMQQAQFLAAKRKHLAKENLELKDKIRRQKRELAVLTKKLVLRK